MSLSNVEKEEPGMQIARMGVIVALGVLVAASRSDAQQVRSFTTPERRPEQRVSIPRA